MSKPTWPWVRNSDCERRWPVRWPAGVFLLSGMHAVACAALPPPVAPPAVAAATIPVSSGPEEDGEAWLAVQIDPRAPAQAFLVLRRNGHLLVRGQDLRQWRLRLPAKPPLIYRDEAWYSLDDLPGLVFSVDQATQTLVLEIPPGLFDDTVIAEQRGYLVPTPSPLGGFFNYDVSVDRQGGSTQTNGLLELGGFKGADSLRATYLIEDGTDGLEVKRLDTTWTQDRPESRTSLRLGDATTGTTSWARSVRFGGIQWATNFDTQPTLVTYPQPGIKGEAALPSTVDLYINDALRSRQDVAAGPFSIQDLPVMTGQGQVSMVVRDVLGREQVVTAPYYASPSLLRAGLQDFSYEMGFVRKDYGLASNDYGRFAAVATHRVGLSDQLTGEAHAELLRDQQTLGLGGAMLWPGAGIFNASLAASHGDSGAGGLAALGFQRQTRLLSFGGNVQLASRRFQQLGLGSVYRLQTRYDDVTDNVLDKKVDRLAPRMTSQLFVSLDTREGSFGLSYIRQDYRDEDDIELLSANYNVSVRHLGFFSFALLRTLAPQAQTSVSLSFTLPLGARTTGSVSALDNGGKQQVTAEVQRSLPAGSGYGYRVLAAAGDPSRGEAGVSMQNDIGTYSLEAAQDAAGDGLRANISGGVIVLGGSAYLSRHIDESFGVVQVPGYAHVRVYADNQVVAVTDDQGNALLPRLRPYQKNPIRIEQADLPMDAQIDAIGLDAIPYARSGILLPFPIRRSHGATLTILLDNGQPIPAGAHVQIADQSEAFPVGLRGQAYLTGLATNDHLIVTWHGQRCEFDVSFPASSADLLPDLGRFLCTGVAP